MNKYSRAIIIAIFSTVLVSLLIALLTFTPKSDQMANIYYPSIFEIFIFHAIFLIPPFIVGGVISIYLMGLFKKHFNFFKHLPYFANLIAYIFGSLLITILYIFILAGGIRFPDDLLYGPLFIMAISCSVIYYHFYLLSETICNKKLKTTS